MANLRGMVLGSFVGDALALGPHWVYNIEDISNQLGQIEGLTAPVTQYHKNKEKGDFTHYGDKSLMLFQFLKMNPQLEKEAFYKNYKAFYQTYTGYFDQATKETMEQLNRGVLLGSHSSELAGMVGFAPIIFVHHKDIEKGVHEVLQATMWTHDDKKLLERTNFLVRLTYEVLKGKKPSLAIEHLRENAPGWIESEVDTVYSKLQLEPEKAIKLFGQGCDSGYAFPAVLYFILKYEEDFKEALLKNIHCGGDSAARGMVIGGILGAYHGEHQIPIDWIASMKHFKEIENLMM